jgi:hypothetical protein
MPLQESLFLIGVSRAGLDIRRLLETCCSSGGQCPPYGCYDRWMAAGICFFGDFLGFGAGLLEHGHQGVVGVFGPL